MKVIIVGAGGTTRDLLRRLSPSWEVVVVDTDAERLALAAAVREVETFTGDGSSRVVLDRLPLDEARRAHELMDNRAILGKLLLKP